MALTGTKVAILATDRFEQAELEQPMQALRAAGATVTVVAPHGGEIQGMNHADPGDKFKVDQTLDQAKPESFDALVLPGGVANPDELRTMKPAVAFVKHFMDQGKPVGVICHGPWTLIEANAVRGRTMTSWPSLHTDLVNAGAKWVDREVVVDGNMVSSRKPDDLPAFDKALVKLLEEHAARRHAA
ncbi:MAG: type 1 glutamine amidotransferase domain-containing protein [Acidiphilium sp.]